MTKKRNLTTFMIAIMIMLFSLPANAQGKVGYAEYNVDSKTVTFKGGGSVPSDAWGLNKAGVAPEWSGNSDCTQVVFDVSFKNVRPTSCFRWFYSFSNLTTIKGIENLNTEEVTNMSYMFNRCSGLSSLDLSSFNTEEVTTMDWMFSSCSSLTSLDLSSFNTANVGYMDNMFSYCSGLKTIYVSDDFTTDHNPSG